MSEKNNSVLSKRKWEENRQMNKIYVKFDTLNCSHTYFSYMYVQYIQLLKRIPCSVLHILDQRPFGDLGLNGSVLFLKNHIMLVIARQVLSPRELRASSSELNCHRLSYRLYPLRYSITL
jgi:hypothetical protein